MIILSPLPLLLVSFTIGFLWGYIWQLVTTKMHVLKYAHVHGYHFHHSLFGIAAFVVAFFIHDTYVIKFLIGFGLGDIIQHYIMGDHEFVSKD